MKSTDRAEDSTDRINGYVSVTKMTNELISLRLPTTDMLWELVSCLATLRPHPAMGLMIFNYYVLIVKYLTLRF